VDYLSDNPSLLEAYEACKRSLQVSGQNLLDRLVNLDEIKALRLLRGDYQFSDLSRIISEAEERAKHAETEQAKLARLLDSERSRFYLEIQRQVSSRLDLEHQVITLQKKVELSEERIEKLSKKANQFDDLQSQLRTLKRDFKAVRGERNSLVVALAGVKSRLTKTADKKWGGAAISQRKISQLEAEIQRLNNELSFYKGGDVLAPPQGNLEEKEFVGSLAYQPSNPIEPIPELEVPIGLTVHGSTAEQEAALALLCRLQEQFAGSVNIILAEPNDTPPHDVEED